MNVIKYYILIIVWNIITVVHYIVRVGVGVGRGKMEMGTIKIYKVK